MKYPTGCHPTWLSMGEICARQEELRLSNPDVSSYDWIMILYYGPLTALYS